ncbi:pilus assembly FimT family protein [Hydrogenophaga defluvii]|uniref:Type II secretion system protein H n=1 Tax=Hydrogenophaga defluvii TaxID=249410 RepID=A0ABW2SCP0_9BURK
MGVHQCHKQLNFSRTKLPVSWPNRCGVRLGLAVVLFHRGSILAVTSPIGFALPAHVAGRQACLWRQRRVAGFTMIELMIALAILATLLILAAPSFRDTIDRRRVTNAGVELKDQLQQARSLSVLLNRPVALEFRFADANNWCFGITDRAGCDCSNAALGVADAGSCSFAKPDDLNDRVMAVTSSASYPGVRLLESDATNTTERIVFEPTRGVRDDLLTPTVSYNLTSTQTTRNVRVSVNVIGRTTLCSTSGAMIGGVNAC